MSFSLKRPYLYKASRQYEGCKVIKTKPWLCTFDQGERRGDERWSWENCNSGLFFLTGKVEMNWRCQGVSTERRLFVFRAGWGQKHKARVKRQRADAEMPGKIIFFSACLSSLQAQAQLQIDYWRSLWKPRGKGACGPQPPFETWGQCNYRSVTAQHELQRDTKQQQFKDTKNDYT